MRDKISLKNVLCLIMTLTTIMFNFNWLVYADSSGDAATTPKITMDYSKYETQDQATVTVTYGSTDPNAWVGLYNEGDKPGSTSDGGAASIWWSYLKDDSDAEHNLNVQSGNGAFILPLNTVSGLQAGKTYKLVMFKDGGYAAQASVSFDVYQQEQPATHKISLTSSQYGPGDQAAVTITNGSTDTNAWIGLYNENDVPGDSSSGGVSSIWWKYLPELNIQNGNGIFNLDIKQLVADNKVIPGRNDELALFKDGKYSIDDSIKFSISNTQSESNVPQITLDSSGYGLRDTITATITNASAASDAWVGLYGDDDMPGDSSTGGVPSMWYKYLATDLNIQNGSGKFTLALDTVSKIQQGKIYKLILFKNGGYTIDAYVNFKVVAPTVVQRNLQAAEVKTKAGTAPVLPSTVTETYSDGTTSQVNVAWDDIYPYQYSKAGKFTVEGTAAGTSERARADVSVVEGDGPLYTFNLLSDTHIVSDFTFVHDINLAAALRDMHNVDPNSSKLIIDGDVTDSGLKQNWDAFKAITDQNPHAPMDLVMGNHDTWQENYWADQNKYAISKQNFLNYSGLTAAGKSNVYYDDWIGGNHFIFLGSERSDGNKAYFSDTQINWLKQKLAENAENNKPIFVFVHQPLYDTVAGSKPGQGWADLEQDAELKTILEKYPQTILFTGHTHWEYGSKDVMYNQKYCTMIGVPSCGYCWTDANTEDDISEGFYVEVYKDKVLVEGRNFTTGEWQKNGQFEIDYNGTEKSAVIKAIDNFAASQTSVPQLGNISLTADKDTLVFDGSDKSVLNLKAWMTDGTQADLSKAAIEYTSDNKDIATVYNNGVVLPEGVGTVNITVRVTLDGVTQSATQQIKILKRSDVATLSSITVDGRTVNDFAPDTLAYAVGVKSNSSSIPEIAAVSTDPDAKIVINQAESLQGTAKIVVTSKDGTVTKTYIVNFVSGNTVNSAENPIFSLDQSIDYTDAQNLSISCPTQGAVIRYTTDGTNPDEKAALYTGPISLKDTTIVKAIALKDGFNSSDIISAEYNINIPNGTELVKNGDFSDSDKEWNYNPDDKSSKSVTNGELKISISNLGDSESSVELCQWSLPSLKAGVTYRLTFDARATINRNIEAMIVENGNGYNSCLDKITPITSDMKKYTYDFTVPHDSNYYVELAMGNVAQVGTLPSHDVYIDNISLRNVPVVIAPPTFNILGGTFSSLINVAINSETVGAAVYYTTDGSEPTYNSQKYNGPIAVTSNTVIKALAAMEGLADSKISGVTYKFAKTAVPTFSIAGGTYTSAQQISISSATEGATIRYTTDGTVPTEKSQVYSGPITVSSSTVIKAYAAKSCHTDSDIAGNTYSIVIPTPTPSQNQGSVPTPVPTKTPEQAPEPTQTTAPAAVIKEFAKDGSVRVKNDDIKKAESLVVNGQVTLKFDKAAVQSLAGKGDFSITAKPVNVSSLGTSNLSKIGDRPVYELQITTGNDKVTSFGGGFVKVSIPYTLKTGEDPNAILIYYINSDNKLIPVNSVYDEAAGTVNFTTTHFSKYAVGYNKVSFTDVSDWSKDYITKLSAMSIVSGDGKGKFAPLEKVTRSQFVKMLFGISGTDNSVLQNYKKSEFNDVENSDWFEPYVMWAYKNDIVSGVGNNKFAPNDVITREQMSVMLYKFIMSQKINIKADVKQASFADDSLISSWAKQSVEFMKNSGIINGKGNDSFDPQGSATREEAAKVIAEIIEKSAK